jgi:ribosome-binding factor A
MSQRKAKVEHALRDVLSDLVRREVRDPRVAKAGLISITRVELNVDFSVANVYISVVGPGGGSSPQAEVAVAALARAAKFLRGPAGRQLNLAHPPELRFLLDESAVMQERIRAVLLEDEAKARAAGREVESSEPVRPAVRRAAAAAAAVEAGGMGPASAAAPATAPLAAQAAGAEPAAHGGDE